MLSYRYILEDGRKTERLKCDNTNKDGHNSSNINNGTTFGISKNI